jgi:maltose-binding protein MalE
MKKFLSIAVAALVVIIAVAACGSTSSSTTHATTHKKPTKVAQFDPPKVNPKAKAICTQIITDVQSYHPGDDPIAMFGKLGRDSIRLAPYVNASQQKTVFDAVGRISKFLKAIGNGDPAGASAANTQKAGKELGYLCGGITTLGS